MVGQGSVRFPDASLALHPSRGYVPSEREKIMSEYSFGVSAQDLWVALDCEADRAQREGFKGVEERQRKTALHLRNAQAQMSYLCPEGYNVRARIVFDFVPAVNAYLRDDIREGRAS